MRPQQARYASGECVFALATCACVILPLRRRTRRQAQFLSFARSYNAIICCKLAVLGVVSQLAQIPVGRYEAIAEDIAYAPTSKLVHRRKESDEGSNKKLRCMCTR